MGVETSRESRKKKYIIEILSDNCTHQLNASKKIIMNRDEYRDIYVISVITKYEDDFSSFFDHTVERNGRNMKVTFEIPKSYNYIFAYLDMTLEAEMKQPEFKHYIDNLIMNGDDASNVDETHDKFLQYRLRMMKLESKSIRIEFFLRDNGLLK